MMPGSAGLRETLPSYALRFLSDPIPMLLTYFQKLGETQRKEAPVAGGSVRFGLYTAQAMPPPRGKSLLSASSREQGPLRDSRPGCSVASPESPRGRQQGQVSGSEAIPKHSGGSKEVSHSHTNLPVTERVTPKEVAGWSEEELEDLPLPIQGSGGRGCLHGVLCLQQRSGPEKRGR